MFEGETEVKKNANSIRKNETANWKIAVHKKNC